MFTNYGNTFCKEGCYNGKNGTGNSQKTRRCQSGKL